jgi:hypothetical protein
LKKHGKAWKKHHCKRMMSSISFNERKMDAEGKKA